jgi:hypothetical protein
VTATPYGFQKAAFVPMPSAKAMAPDPASVVTRRPGDTARTRALLLSATYRVPPAATATPVGE